MSQRKPGRRFRAGMMKMEVFICCFLMTAMMSIATGMVYRINAICKQTERFQFATAELRNELDRVTLLPLKQAQEEIKTMEPSEACRKKLPGATLSGTMSKDDLGARVTLELSWDRTGKDAKPVRLCGWLVREEGQLEEQGQ